MQRPTAARPSLMALALAVATAPGLAATAPPPAAAGVAGVAGAALCPAFDPPMALPMAMGSTRILPMPDDIEKVVVPTLPGGEAAAAPAAAAPAGAAPGTAVNVTNAGTTTTSRDASGKVTGSQTVSASKPRDARGGMAEIDVRPVSRRELYVVAKSFGSTNFFVVQRNRRCTEVQVQVGVDTRGLEATLRALAGDTGVKVTSANDAIILSGSVRDNDTVARVNDIAGAFVGDAGGEGDGRSKRIVNLLEVDAPQQVMLEVKVAEVSKALLDTFGIDFSRAYASADSSVLRFLSGIFGGAAASLGQITGAGPNGVPLSSVGTVIGGTFNANAGNGLGSTIGNVTRTIDSSGRVTYVTTYGTVPGRGVTNAAVNAQKTDGLVKVLAEPSVLAISGQTGSFLAGGKIFIPVMQDNGKITLEEKEFGVKVRFTPTVLGNGRINLKVHPEVSELNPTGITISGVGTLSAVLPSFTSREAQTTVQLMDGQSFAIGGLIKNNATSNIKAFPVLGELPVIGALFRSTEFQTDRTELVFVITPRLVKPLPADYKLPTDSYVPPTRQELIFGGKLEGTPPAPTESPAAPAAPAPVAPAAPAPVPVPVPSAVPGGGLDTSSAPEKK